MKIEIKIEVDLEQIERDTGRRFDEKEDLYYYMERVLTYLSTHNKNYTNKQYYMIEELKDIFNAAKMQNFIIPF